MTSRREFLGWSLAATALPGVTVADPRHLETAAAISSVPLYKAIYDRRHAAAAAFAQALHKRGVPAQAIGADITAVWFNDLSLRWREAPVAVAGLTRPETLVLLEQLAWTYRMRAVVQAEHRPAAAGGVEHRLRGPVEWLGRLADADDGTHWIRRMAHLCAQCPTGRERVQGYAERRLWTDDYEPAVLERPLVSWVIAAV